METEDYEYISYDERLFRIRLESPLDGLKPQERFERGILSTKNILRGMEQIVRPIEVEYSIIDQNEESNHERRLIDEDGLSTSKITDALKETAEDIGTPRLGSVIITKGIRVTLSDGIFYCDESTNTDIVRREGFSSAKFPFTPLEISLRQMEVMKPCMTEVIDITGHSDHWLDGDEEKYYLPPATPLAKLDQSRLATSLSRLYDSIDPVELTIDTFENAEGWHTPQETVPGAHTLETRHIVEWVLENFKQNRDEDSLELEFTGEEVHPLVNSPDEKIETFLRNAFPQDRYSEGATVTVNYPDDEALLIKDEGGRWDIKNQSDL
ncbi:hypothetical protein [Halosimplex pelagicum]|uniref:Uncharacterized protein n=1 Tax=Halosimplex pelagicum TaxID=869886 RepID=A0A7D5T4S3_9EURY|nr:hypothetical protein [Halosimplex pelagicum]QLH81688.1 hypothetical protein HZS54_08640 [Halosimplex pelagicum]